jgi:ferredoxin--NADP+ reductase
MNLREYDISNPYQAVVLSNDRITPPEYDAEVRHLVLDMQDYAFEYHEGQSIGVLAPGPFEFGNQHHLRLYSIASPRGGEAGQRNHLSICVRRCFYIDEISGERYPGKGSNYLCDTVVGDTIQVTGPYGVAFNIPEDENTNLLMVGVGTGIAPFRAFIRHLYEVRGGWKGKVRLFYGAKTGTELVYLNDFRKDLGLYYDNKSFQAFAAVSPRPHFDMPPALYETLVDHKPEVWEMVQNPKTHVYVAGLMDAERKFEKAMSVAAGSEENWVDTRASLIASNRYSELLYE